MQPRNLLPSLLGFPAALCALTFLILGFVPCGADENEKAITPVPPGVVAIETGAGGRLGVAMIDTENGAIVAYRPDERFPLCSTAKVMAVSSLLQASESMPDLLDVRIRYGRNDLILHSPITEAHLRNGMTLGEICDAALRYSDNAALNLILARVGGPAGVTRFARSIGDRRFRLDRLEPELNSAIPGDERDTTTPLAMAQSLRTLLLGPALLEPQRSLLINWMKRNTTGDACIRAGVPGDWIVADKTGGGEYGSINDIAVVWPRGRKPIILALYFTQPGRDAPLRRDVLAATTRLLLTHAP